MYMFSMEASQILTALTVGESIDWEFKSAKGGFPGSFWDTYSAMANTNGGRVVFGIRETESTPKIEGLTAEQIYTYQKILWDTLNNPSKVNRNILSPNLVHIVPAEGKNLLQIDIPRATRIEGPIYIGTTPFGNTYRRCHQGDYRCTDEQVRRMLADAHPTPADQRILRDFSLEDLDPLSLEQYRNRFAASKPNHPWHPLPLPQFLEKLGGWRRDRESNESGITLAALLMFGRHSSIMDIAAVPNYWVDYREKLNPEIRWDHRIFPDGTWEPNLFQFYQKIWPHFTADLKVPFRLKGMQRIDETPIHEALREALVNAIIHADYTTPGGIVIERHRDRFILDNPGTLLVSFEQLRRGGISECRNKALQTMFMMIGSGEKAGSGVHRIQNEWKNQHWRAPAFTVTEQPDRVKLVLPMVSLIPENTLSSLQKRFGQKFSHLSHLEVVALATAEIEKEVSNTRLQELETDHPAQITQILQRLCAKGMLVSDNRRRWACYKIATSPHLTPDSPHLETLADPIAKTRKSSNALMRQTILELCKVKPLRLEELAKLLQRDSKALQNHYLTKMVSEGLLQLKYPETPNLPDQAYTNPHH